MKYLFIIVLMINIPLTYGISQNNPYRLMHNITNNIFSRLNNEQENINRDPNYLRNIVREELFPYMQIKFAGALVLGNYYREAKPEQRNAYFKAFQDYLEQVYSQALVLYNNKSYKIIIPEKKTDDAVIVPVRVVIIDHSNQPVVHLDFQWRKNSSSDNWQIFDMIVEGISMINTKHIEWTSILRTKGIDGLTETLHAASKVPIIVNKYYS